MFQFLRLKYVLTRIQFFEIFFEWKNNFGFLLIVSLTEIITSQDTESASLILNNKN